MLATNIDYIINLLEMLCFSVKMETGLDPDKMKPICKGHVIEDGMYKLNLILQAKEGMF